MRVVQIVAELATEAAGPSYSVRRLAESVAGDGLTSEIYATGHSIYSNVKTFPIEFRNVPILKKLHVSRELARALELAARGGAVLHAHGLWLMPNIYPACSTRRHPAPLVVSPRGMLAREARAFSPGRKLAMWFLLQKRALAAATVLHATSIAEAEDIRTAGLRNPIAVIPNGIDLPEIKRSFLPSTRSQRMVLYLGRVHPKKSIDHLLTAWAGLEKEHPNWRLKIVGPSEGGYGEALLEQARTLGLQRVEFDGPQFGAIKAATYAEADLFVLPTRNENFGMVVAEALAAGTPVICTRGAPWSGLSDEGCGWWIDHGAQPLGDALRVAMAQPRTVLDEMGARGRAWMARDFGWQQVGLSMRSVYCWALRQSPPPPCIMID